MQWSAIEIDSWAKSKVPRHGKIDPVRERERLVRRYAAMSDLELQKVGGEPEVLTEWARQTLKEEMDKRGLEWSPDAVSAKTKAILDDDMLVPLRTYTDRMAAISNRSVLQSAGIEPLLSIENQASLRWGAAHNIEIKLMFRTKDLKAAQQFLEQKAALDSAEESERIENEHLADQVPSKSVILRT